MHLSNLLNQLKININMELTKPPVLKTAQDYAIDYIVDIDKYLKDTIDRFTGHQESYCFKFGNIPKPIFDIIAAKYKEIGWHAVSNPNEYIIFYTTPLK